LPNLVLSLLDVHDVLGIDLVRAVHSHGYLIDVVGYTADEPVHLIKLFIIEMDDVTLKDHSPDELAP